MKIDSASRLIKYTQYIVCPLCFEISPSPATQKKKKTRALSKLEKVILPKMMQHSPQQKKSISAANRQFHPSCISLDYIPKEATALKMHLHIFLAHVHFCCRRFRVLGGNSIDFFSARKIAPKMARESNLLEAYVSTCFRTGFRAVFFESPGMGKFQNTGDTQCTVCT